jgi:hypothetical protein
VREVDLSPGSPFHDADPAMHNALLRERLDTVAALDAADGGWHALSDIPNIGVAHILNLVNWLRGKGVELSWFADWDQHSAELPALAGRHRAPPLRTEGTTT